MGQENENLNYLGKTLNELRTEKNISLEDLSAETNISKHDLNLYEKGITRPDTDDFIALGKAMKIHPLEITSRSLDRSKFFKAA